MAFLEDLKGFYGTGEKNRAGQSLEEFLDRYDPKNMTAPAVPRILWRYSVMSRSGPGGSP